MQDTYWHVILFSDLSYKFNPKIIFIKNEFSVESQTFRV